MIRARKTLKLRGKATSFVANRDGRVEITCASRKGANNTFVRGGRKMSGLSRTVSQWSGRTERVLRVGNILVP